MTFQSVIVIKEADDPWDKKMISFHGDESCSCSRVDYQSRVPLLAQGVVNIGILRNQLI